MFDQWNVSELSISNHKLLVKKLKHFRLISTTRLNPLRDLHLWPICGVVSPEPLSSPTFWLKVYYATIFLTIHVYHYHDVLTYVLSILHRACLYTLLHISTSIHHFFDL